MTIMQGDSYPIYIQLTQDGQQLTPDMVAEVEVCVGDSLTKLLSKGEVFFEEDTGRWYIYPSQQDTMALDTMAHPVVVRIRYKSATPDQVVGVHVGFIMVENGISEAVI